MGLIFKVGEHHDFPPVPKNFPKCGSWLPPIEEEKDTEVSSARPAVEESTTEPVHVVEDYEENFIPYRLTNGSLSHQEKHSITSVSGSNSRHENYVMLSMLITIFACLLR